MNNWFFHLERHYLISTNHACNPVCSAVLSAVAVSSELLNFGSHVYALCVYVSNFLYAACFFLSAVLQGFWARVTRQQKETTACSIRFRLCAGWRRTLQLLVEIRPGSQCLALVPGLPAWACWLCPTTQRVRENQTKTEISYLCCLFYIMHLNLKHMHVHRYGTLKLTRIRLWDVPVSSLNQNTSIFCFLSHKISTKSFNFKSMLFLTYQHMLYLF